MSGQTLNEADVRRFYKLLRHRPDEFTELRVFVPNKREPPKARAWVQSEDEFVAVCKKWSKSFLVYAGLNPRKAYGVGKAEHVSRIVGIPFDVDADHPKDDSATDEEKREAYEKLGELKSFLLKKGYLNPYTDDSGNGYHLIQWTDMSFNDIKEMDAKLKAYFYEVKDFFPNLDSIYGPARVLKVPGTWALKGKGTEKRPHRQAQILEPGDPEVDIKLATYILSLETEALSNVVVEKEAKPRVQPIEPATEKKVRASPKWNKKWDQKRPMNVIQPMLKAMQNDVKFNNLYHKINRKGEKLTSEDIKEQFGSRSEAEFYLIMRAYHYRLLPGEIPRFMTGCKIGKWQEESRNYHERTIKRAWRAFRSEPSRFFSKRKFVPKWMADELLEIFSFAATGEKSKVWAYKPNKGIWENDGAELIHEETTKRLESQFRSIHVTETVVYIRYTNYIDKNLLGGSTYKVVTLNGVLNLNTYKLTPFDPELYEINRIPVTYNPDAKCPKIIKFLEEVLKPEDFNMIIEVFGYCLLKSYPIARIIIFTGSGANGKSQLITILKNFLGKKNTSKLTLQQIANNTFFPAQLHGKMANLAADIPSTPIKYTGIIKTLTGSDELTAHHKYFAPFDFMNYAKLIFSTNEVPPADDNTPAWLRRPILVDFPNVFLAGAPGTILDIGNKLSTPEEFSGLLNLALEGLQRLLKQGKFTGEGAQKERTEKFIRESNPAQYFITHFIEEAPSPLERVDKVDLYKNYVKLCHALRRRPLAHNKFSMEIPTYLPYIDDGDYDKVIGKTKKGKPRTRKTRVWYGIKIKTEALAQAIAELKTKRNHRYDHYDRPDPRKKLESTPSKKNGKRERDGKYRSDRSNNDKNAVVKSSRDLTLDPEALKDDDVRLMDRLIEEAVAILEENGGRMQQKDLFQALTDAGYHYVNANTALRGDKRFIFMGMEVRLGTQLEEKTMTTGKIDIDKTNTDKPKSLQVKLQKVLEVISEMERIPGVVKDKDLFVELMSVHGIEKSEAARIIGVLTRDGTIYSPRPGYYKRTT